MIYAEVIGDPIAQSKSPIIHKYWLSRLGIEADYRRTRVASGELADYLQERSSDSNWRGCNVTIPHKETVIPLLDRLDSGAEAIGAVNCVMPENGALVGYNTDIDGVAAALNSTELLGRKAALIGAGGGARAVVAYLANQGADRIAVVARNLERAEPLRALASDVDMHILPFDQADVAFGDAAAIINASPLGMVGADPMPRFLLDPIRIHARAAAVFDMVTTPTETKFLSAGREGCGRPVDGLTMLVGQAARAFELFFGETPPPPDQQLRDLLTTDSRDSA
jgi:shikimate dehydrogenase